MSDYSNTKKATSGTFPQKAVDAASFQRMEPLLSAAQLRNRFFIGIPMISPLTRQIIDDDILKDLIQSACAEVELDLKIDIRPTQRLVRLPYNRGDFENFNYIQVPFKPILSVEQIAIVTANNETVYQTPKEWIDMGNAIHGRLNVIPFMSYAGNIPAQIGSGNGFGPYILTTHLRDNIPSYIQVTCTCGFSADDQVPIMINRIIGLKAAMMLIMNLIPQFQLSSHSLSTDGLSQSQTNQAPQLYQIIYDKYQQEYEDQVAKVSVIFMNRISVSTF